MQHKATLTKRVLSLIMVIAMMLTLAPLSVFAAETTRIVYFQNNWLWTDVRAYSFDAAGNYDVAWPGAAMTFVENDGTYDIYKFEVPATATTVIINGIKNDGSGNRDQTPNLTQFPTGVCHNMMWNDGNSVGTFAYTPPTGDDTDPSTEPIVTQPTTPAVTYDYIIAGNKYRANDDIFTDEINHAPLKVSTLLMAQAEVNANWMWRHFISGTPHAEQNGEPWNNGENAAGGWKFTNYEYDPSDGDDDGTDNGSADWDSPYDAWYLEERFNYIHEFIKQNAR